jgi:ATP synthase protein I
MSENEKHDDLDGLERRLKEASARRAEAADSRAKERGAGLGFAFRIGTELVAGIAVGVAIGWLLDRWLDTRPWLMILFFVLGSAAGMMNVFRSVSGQGHAVGFRRKRTHDDDTDDA